MSLYSVRLFDSGGDGWQGATYRIFNREQTYMYYQGTMEDGHSTRSFHCIPDTCGWIIVGGGEADSEISWVFDASGGSSFQGMAPSTEYCACLSAIATRL